MMRKQNKGSDFLPVQTRKNSELSIILTSLIFHCELAMINFCPPRSSTGKWVVLRRELGGNAVDEKSVAVGIGVGYQKDPRWAKKSTPPVRGGFWKTTWAVLYPDSAGLGIKFRAKFVADDINSYSFFFFFIEKSQHFISTVCRQLTWNV